MLMPAMLILCALTLCLMVWAVERILLHRRRVGSPLDLRERLFCDYLAVRLLFSERIKLMQFPPDGGAGRYCYRVALGMVVARRDVFAGVPAREGVESVKGGV